MEEIGRKKTAVFIVIQDEKKTYHSLVTIFLKQCYETLIRVAQETGGKLPYRTNFILDEFANMPPLKDVTTMVTAARSRSIRFTFIIQNFAQLYQVYGKENGETIKGNCGNIIYLISSELAALEEISKMCGEVKSGKDDKTASTPLVTVSDLQRMKFGSMIVLRTRCMPFKTTLTPNYKMVQEGLWGHEYGKSEYPQREKREVKLFDLKKIVDEKRQKKINDMLNGNGGMNMGMPPMPGMPSIPGMNMGSMPSMPGMNMGMPSMPGMNMPPMPGIGTPRGSQPGNNQPFNVDDLVKRIDAKIAELEEEERKEKEEQARKEKQEKMKEDIKEIPKPKTIETREITDDQFFDDFFSEDE